MVNRRYGACGRAARGQAAVLDRGLASILGILGLAGLFGAYQHFASSSSVDDVYEELQLVVHEVRSAGRNHPSYDGIDSDYVVARGHLAPALVNGGSIVVRGGGVVSVTPGASPAATVTLGLAPLSQAQCVGLGSRALDPAQVSVTVNGTAFAGVPSLPDVEAACGRGIASALAWVVP